jgi:hypothetical protein
MIIIRFVYFVKENSYFFPIRQQSRFYDLLRQMKTKIYCGVATFFALLPQYNETIHRLSEKASVAASSGKKKKEGK